MTLLVLEDDPIIQEEVCEYFKEKNHHVVGYFDGESFLNAPELMCADVFLLDINVPGLSGLDVLGELKRLDIHTPAVFITALSDIGYMKEAFTKGAHDYLKKPFILEELEVRIHRLLHQGKSDCAVGNCMFSFETMRLYNVLNQEVELSMSEKKVLYLLLKTPNTYVSSQTLLEYAWEGMDVCENTLRTKIKKLREKLGQETIQNSRNLGYKIQSHG